MLTKFLLEFWSVLGRFFDNFASKMEGRETKKLGKTSGLKDFLLFRPTRHQEAIWLIFWLTWPSNWGPTPNKIQFKRFPVPTKKGDRNHDANWLGIGIPLGTNLAGFWRQLGRQVGSKLAPKSNQRGSQDDVKKSLKKGARHEHAPHHGKRL